MDSAFASIQHLLRDISHLAVLRLFPRLSGLVFRSVARSFVFPNFARLEELVADDDAAAAVATPVLLLHGALDTLISVSHSRTLYAAAAAAATTTTSIVEFVELPNIGHNDAYRSELWAPAIVSFMERVESRTRR